uniref:GP-PDE domain-containing protein n=1 Tax=Catagonus wagneri TaxID=51154 RepID=A0A8C3YAX1_9CETA
MTSIYHSRRWREFNSWIECNFNYNCYITYLSGCYSCEWEAKQKKPRRPLCCCSLIDQLFYPWLIVACFMAVILLFTWIETSNEHNGFDWVVFLGTGIWFFWSLVLLSLFWILAIYTSLLVCLEVRMFILFPQILILLVLAICSFFFWILFTYWKERWLTIGLSLQVFAPYIHLASISMMVMLAWPVAFYVIHLEGEGMSRGWNLARSFQKPNKMCNMLTKLRALQVAVVLPFFLILLCLYVVPWGTHSPCIQEKDKLGPKPSFFGHRGAPMLGPENTMMSFEKAVEHGAFGLESDVQISTDRVPFLMHDYDLRRTTNIREVLPNASLKHCGFFGWYFLSTLNAGKWFSHSWVKPFYHMKPLSDADRETASKQKIPKLMELLKLAQREKKLVIFDLNVPPQKHPARSSYIQIVVSEILDSQIEQHLIIWLPGSQREYVRSRAPGFQHIGRLFTIEQLTKENITRINIDYKRLFYNGLREYKAANISINLYIVNEPWLFSLIWCSRIHSVTTDNIQVLNKINHPYFFMVSWLSRLFLHIWVRKILKIEFPYDPAIPLLAHTQAKQKSENIHAPLCSWQHYFQYPRPRNNLNAHQQINR